MMRLFVLAAAVVAVAAVPPSARAADPGVLKIGMLSGMFRDQQPKVIQTLAVPFRDLMARNVGYTGDVEVVDDPQTLCDRLKENKVHLGVFHGFEFAWAQQRCDDLVPLIVTQPPGGLVQGLLVVSDTSPAVERVETAAMRAGDGRPTLAHWLAALLDDDMGRPAALLERAGLELESTRHAVAAADAPVAPDATRLYSTARELGVRLKADPALTTDLLFAAALLADAEFTAATGLRVEPLLALMRSPETEPSPALGGGEFVIADPPEQLTAARAVDVNLNRSREALRVLDDYARFVLDDRGLTEQLKTLRHALAEASNRLPKHLLLAARDTPNDVGTTIGTQREYARTTPAEVAAVNAKRLQEALRSTEEFGKVLDAGFGKAVEAIRYEAYTLERQLVRRDSSRAKLADARLYVLLTGSQCATSMDWVIEQAALGGADVFQLREKSLTDRELIARARQVRAWTRKANALFVMNDRPDIARLVDADGVHLGQDDLPVAAARRVVGPDMMIGVSTHTIEQVRRAVTDGADYIGVGPTFPSSTKTFEAFAGLDFVREVVAETTLPAFALGGISASNVAEVVAAGARRVAVSAAIATAAEPRAVATALRWAIAASGVT